MAQTGKCSRCGPDAEKAIPELKAQEINHDAALHSVVTGHVSGSENLQHKGVQPDRICVSNAPPNAGGCGGLAVLLGIFFSSNYLLINRGNDTGTNLALLLLSLLLTTAAAVIMACFRKGERNKSKRYCASCQEKV